VAVPPAAGVRHRGTAGRLPALPPRGAVTLDRRILAERPLRAANLPGIRRLVAAGPDQPDAGNTPS
jgi:hypothetical protein